MSEEAGRGQGMKKRIRAIVTGRVQGVSYRAYTAEEAERLGVVGWVRNLPDRTVELEAEGPVAAVDALVAWCRQGPPSASVIAVHVEKKAVVGKEREFRVRF